jgi:hypothetical protein
MPSWVIDVAGTFVASLIVGYGFLRLRCRGIGPPFGPRARYWALFIVVSTAVISGLVGLLLVVGSKHVPAYVGIIVPSGLWLSKLPPQRDRDMLRRSFSDLLTLPFSRLYDRMGDDLENWVETRLRVASSQPQWIAEAAQYYSNQAEGLPRDNGARVSLDRWRDSITHKIGIVRLIDLDADTDRLRASLHLHPSTQHVRADSDDERSRLADRLETEAQNELRLFLACIYRLGYHRMLVYPFRPNVARVDAPPRRPLTADRAEPLTPEL